MVGAYCYLARHGVMENGDPMSECSGELVRCHLIRRSLLRRYGISSDDSRTWVHGCGGLSGVGGHHGDFDSTRRLRIPRSELPAATERFCEAKGLTWYLDRFYGER